MPDKLVLVYTAAGQVEANFIKSLLEANSVPVLSVQEGAGEAYGLTVGVLGEVQLWVAAEHQATAQELIEEYERASSAATADPTPDEAGAPE
jgi:hypothetical protein